MTLVDVQSPEKRSTSVHFRIWTDVYQSLEEEARKQEVNLNTLVNHVLATHARDEWVYRDSGFVKMSKESYGLIQNAVPDDKLVEVEKQMVKNAAYARMLARSGSITLEAVLDEIRFCSRNGWYSVHEAERAGRRVLTMMHDFGPKGSLAFSAYLAGLLALVDVRGKITTTTSSVMVEY